MTSPLSPEAVAQMVADRDDVFMIMKRDLYYRPNAQGYTGIKDHAGRYTLEQVAAMFPNMESPHQDGTEFIRECDAPEYTKACYHDLKEAHQAQRIATLAAENATLRQHNDIRGQNMRDTWEAMQAMRDAINDHIPLPSTESDLLQGPENSVFCEVVATAVIGALATLRASEAAALEALAEIGAVVAALEGKDSLDREMIRNIGTRIAALTPTADKEPKT